LLHARDHAPDQGDIAIELPRRLADDDVELGAVAAVDIVVTAHSDH
jgi:hypothetical protein